MNGFCALNRSMESAAALSCRTFAFRCIFTPPCHSATSSQRLNKTRTSFSSMPALRRTPFRSSGEVHEKKATKQNAASPQTHKSSFLHVFIFHAHLVRRVLSEQLFQHHDTEGSVVRQCFWSSEGGERGQTGARPQITQFGVCPLFPHGD